MNPGDPVVYQEKSCVVLDPALEGYALNDGQVLLEDVTHYSTCRGRIRHLAYSDAVGQEFGRLLQASRSE